MAKLWAGRTSGSLDSLVNDFNASITVDSKMFREDIEGSIAHVTMLGNCGILKSEDSVAIATELAQILADIDAGKLDIDLSCEDIHSFVEMELTARIGELGKMLHTARSRNDQVAVDLRLYVKKEITTIKQYLLELINVLVAKATENIDVIMPGYTHLQRAQPITFAHHLLAYANMFIRDIGRMTDCYNRMNYSPLGSAALAGTGYPIDRAMSASLLGFDGYTLNSLDGVSDRDYCLELQSGIATIMMHLSRFSEEIILWSSWEYKFIELDNGYSTGSSIMPQKKNPDMAELIRGKTGRTYGNLMSTLTMLKGLPLAYNKDMQEDKEAIFDSIETVKVCLQIMAPMVATATVNADKMLSACEQGFINATDCADYLVGKGIPFRTAYGIVGKLVDSAINKHSTLDKLSFADYVEASDKFEEDIFDYIKMEACLNRRTSAGAPAKVAVEAQLGVIKERLLTI
ncbi:MAG: argininosuccinate lyase [Bacillota bacterium]